MRVLRAVVTVLVFVALTAIGWAAVDLTRSPPPVPVETIELDTGGDPAPRKPRKERPDDRGASGGSGGAPPAPAPPPPPAGTDDDGDDDGDDDDGATDDDSD